MHAFAEFEENLITANEEGVFLLPVDAKPCRSPVRGSGRAACSPTWLAS
jgi:hypothetical protein